MNIYVITWIKNDCLQGQYAFAGEKCPEFKEIEGRIPHLPNYDYPRMKSQADEAVKNFNPNCANAVTIPLYVENQGVVFCNIFHQPKEVDRIKAEADRKKAEIQAAIDAAKR